MNHRFCVCLVLALWTFACSSAARAQDEASEPAAEEGRVVQFQRDIAPLFATRCLECHDEKESKGGFRIDDAATVADYLTPGEGAASTLMTDYLQTADTDMLMPPPSHGGPLSPAELSLIRVWIDEGAQWPEGAVVAPAGATGVAEPEATEATQTGPRSLLGRVWAFQGYFHPAVVHFPIALLTIGGLFVVIGWFHPVLGNHVALSCLFLGSVSAVVASAMGWAFASEQGYGSGAAIDFDSTAFWHRWSGIVVAAIAVLTSMIAIRSLSGRSLRLRVLWKTGLLICAALVGLVGHQGGELTYGEAHYERAFNLLLPGRGDVEASANEEAVPEASMPEESAAEEPAAEAAAPAGAEVEPSADTPSADTPSADTPTTDTPDPSEDTAVEAAAPSEPTAEAEAAPAEPAPN